jgi:hypothetical protein
MNMRLGKINKKSVVAIAASMITVIIAGIIIGVLANEKKNGDTILSFDGLIAGYITLNAGETITIKVNSNKEIKDTLEFGVEDTSVANIRGIGKNSASLKGISAGTTTIYAKSGDENTQSAEAYIYVRKTEFDGAGTKEDPYRIANKEDLLLMQSKAQKEFEVLEYSAVYFEGKYFKLMNDICFGDYEWENSVRGFAGIFDGNAKGIYIGKTIANGLFGVLKRDAVVKNLKVDLIAVGIDNWDVRGIVAGENNGIIDACVTSGSINFSFNTKDAKSNPVLYFIGGIVGLNYSGTMENCFSDADITVNIIDDTPEIESIIYVGGFTGESINSYLDDCIFVGSIKVNRKKETDGIGVLIGNALYGQSNLYYDETKIDNREENGLNEYYIPLKAIGKHFNNGNIFDINVYGVSDWSTIDFSGWDQELWYFSEGVPCLRIFGQ